MDRGLQQKGDFEYSLGTKFGMSISGGAERYLTESLSGQILWCVERLAWHPTSPEPG